MTVAWIIGGMLGVGILLVIHGTIFKTRWGINRVAQIECPGCHQVHRQVRVPRNLRQALWGGNTCECGLEVDKWNRPVNSKWLTPGVWSFSYIVRHPEVPALSPEGRGISRGTRNLLFIRHYSVLPDS